VLDERSVVLSLLDLSVCNPLSTAAAVTSSSSSALLSSSTNIQKTQLQIYNSKYKIKQKECFEPGTEKRRSQGVMDCDESGEDEGEHILIIVMELRIKKRQNEDIVDENSQEVDTRDEVMHSEMSDLLNTAAAVSAAAAIALIGITLSSVSPSVCPSVTQCSVALES